MPRPRPVYPAPLAMPYLSLLCSVLLILTTSGAQQPEVQAVQSAPPPPDQPAPQVPSSPTPETTDAAAEKTPAPALDVEQPQVAFKLADGGTVPKTVLLAGTETKSKYLV